MHIQNLVTIDLDALRHNHRLLISTLPKDVRVMPVVKADAYGHGMLQVATALQKEGVTDFAVARPEEGIALREGGIQGQVLVLGATMERPDEEAIAHDLTQTVFLPETVRWLDQEAKKLGKCALVHIKLDTGMNRIGLRTVEEAKALREALDHAPNVRATGIYTHFADADEPSQAGQLNAFTLRQLERFNELRACFPPGLPAHAANSAMSLLAPNAYFSMVREGIVLYGYPPVPTVLPFRPVLTWTTEVVHVKQIEAGETIGYGCTFTAPHAMRIATVAVGYGDGYHRAASNRGMMLIHGKRVPIVGRVCMDQTMVDVTELSNVKAGDEAVLIGEQQGERISAEDLASWTDTISYEVLLAITPRVPRIWTHA